MSRTRLRLALDAVIALVAVVITVAGVTLLIAGRHSDAYLNAPRCAHDADALTQECYIETAVVLDSATVHRNGKLGPQIPTITITWPGVADHLTLTIPYPTGAFYTAEGSHPGSHLWLKVWDGIPTAVYVPAADGSPGNAMRTDANPLSLDELRWWGGFSLIGVGLVILVVHPGWPLLRFGAAIAGDPHPRWQRAVGSAGGVLSHSRLRVALGALIGLNLLDVASSIFGGKAGTFESNPVAWAMVQRWGPLGGFMALKLPALIAVTLAMTRLPARIALVVAWAGCLVMAWVVLGNVELVWTKA